MRCLRCNEELVPAKTELTYLGHTMTYELPRCPKCGQVYLSEEIVRGKMRDVEITLEEK